MTRYFVLIWDQPAYDAEGQQMLFSKPKLHTRILHTDAEDLIHRAIMQGQAWKLFIVYENDIAPKGFAAHT